MTGPNAAPLAKEQGTICSAWIDSAHHCQHKHIQTYHCNPYINNDGYWTAELPKAGIPVCLIED